MRALALGALAGTLWLQTRAALPAHGWAWALLVLGVLVLLGTGVLRRQLGCNTNDRFRRHGAAVIMVAIATASGGALFFNGWAMLLAHHRLAESLPASLEGRDVRLTGVVSNLPDATPGGVRFRFDVEAAELDGSPIQVPRRISLGLYGAADSLPRLLPGQRWRFDARLKRPHGLANPQGFDAEAWWLTEGLRAQGNARLRDAEMLDDVVFSVRDTIGRGRAWLRERIVAALPEKRYASVIVALVMGDQRGVASGE